ncbi:MAG: CDP-diacylglycerol--glycerol-3-phosphate 3-phosphatidyltransferase [Coriobacteriales bacterium]|jgi:CDP-diacylglycerol--glycerol-3-phosphate 3-phosphatidyltransferase|nr:CDP-diacylglycerol--glycerol-3-phosphate 3-phosphatidyltransferase [Coriobacteriales bacterium]
MKTHSYQHILTAANIVTTVRIALVPIFVVVILAPWPSWALDVSVRSVLEDVQPWLAVGIFALLALTDSFDGYLARSRNEVTTLGKFLDPLADKILISAALLALVELGELPTWVAFVIITREFLVSGLRMVVSSEGHVISASNLGKIKTITQIIAVLLFIIKSNPNIAKASPPAFACLDLLSWIVMIVALLLTIFSLADYFVKSSAVLALPLSKTEALEGHASDASAPTAQPPSDTAQPSSGIAQPSPHIAQPSSGIFALAQSVLALAQEHPVSLGSAESCTGGMVAASLTAVPGASAVFKGSIVSYANEVKEHNLGVESATLGHYGAVSEQTAVEMAVGALTVLKVDVAVSITGIAGPEGGSPDKPVGTVWIAVAAPDTIQTRLNLFNGDRQQIRQQATAQSLQMLFDTLRKIKRS